MVALAAQFIFYLLENMTLGMVSPQFSYLENGKEYLKWESVSFWGYKEITKGVCLACDRYHINVSPFFPH